jgi:hypothetical protein
MVQTRGFTANPGSLLRPLRCEIAGNETGLLFGETLSDLVHDGCGPGTTFEIGKGFKKVLRRHACKWLYVAAGLAIGAMAAGTGGR